MNTIALSLIIPTFNEEDTTEKALMEIAQALGPELAKKTEILIVDDGTDHLNILAPGFAKMLPFYSVEYCRNAPALGKGASVAHGVEEARGEIVGYLDVDLSTPPRYIAQAMNTLNSGVADVFIGSRRASGSTVRRKQFFLKDILGHMLYFVVQGVVFVGMRHFADTQCGFKFFKNRAAKILYKDLLATDGLTDLEILLRANLLGMNVVECGVEWVDERKSKRSLRRILAGEVIAMVRILVNYKLLGSRQKKNLEERNSRS
jgi:glycosyltransferase involved in cell wall biosynthesis